VRLFTFSVVPDIKGSGILAEMAYWTINSGMKLHVSTDERNTKITHKMQKPKKIFDIRFCN